MSEHNTPASVAEHTPQPQDTTGGQAQQDAPSQQHSTSASAEPVIDPELMDLPPPPHASQNPSPPANGTNASEENANASVNAGISGTNMNDTSSGSIVVAGDKEYVLGREPGSMGITESIASAPNPRQSDFPPPDQIQDDGLDLEALGQLADDDMPGSPTAKLMRVIAPPNAVMAAPTWPPPPPNASVNLFIGRALLSNGNDNWPLKPNDIVNWIRKHYPAEWDGDEGRCSAHRVRTYLARKGADMYYEKLNQGCINGWRIRANHLWRFADGGFQGRGMKQEEAIANQQKENEALATAARKEAAAAALAAGHPNVKVSMSAPGVSDGLPPAKRPKVKAQPRRKTLPKKSDGYEGDLSMSSVADLNAQSGAERTDSTQEDWYRESLISSLSKIPGTSYYVGSEAGPSTTAGADASSSIPDSDSKSTLRPSGDEPQDGSTLNNGSGSGVGVGAGATTATGGENGLDEVGADTNINDPHSLEAGLTNPDGSPVDMNMVQQAMQAAAGQMDELEMGMQLPIEMQMHSNEHDHDDHGDESSRYGVGGGYSQHGGSNSAVGVGAGQGGYGQEESYGYTG
ncbi:hypothetical protein I317_01020 [Kwoniella heveanensis CBS 569]|nr:hypothetical protein I317_01020 [Kwoniella heveanensis CBS 569]